MIFRENENAHHTKGKSILLSLAASARPPTDKKREIALSCRQISSKTAMKTHHTFSFPPVERADRRGLLAIGGKLSPAQVWLAQQSGVFPWDGAGSPILWWAPNPRGVIFCQDLHISRSFDKAMRRMPFQIGFDRAFAHTMDYCAKVHGESWIDEQMRSCYIALHEQGLAHSCELWHEDTLLGGLYGVCLDRVFCGESMFSLVPNASKIVLARLCAFLAAQGIEVLDTQFLTPHLQSMGGVEIPRQEYMRYLGGNPERLRGDWANLYILAQ